MEDSDDSVYISPTQGNLSKRQMLWSKHRNESPIVADSTDFEDTLDRGGSDASDFEISATDVSVLSSPSIVEEESINSLSNDGELAHAQGDNKEHDINGYNDSLLSDSSSGASEILSPIIPLSPPDSVSHGSARRSLTMNTSFKSFKAEDQTSLNGQAVTNDSDFLTCFSTYTDGSNNSDSISHPQYEANDHSAQSAFNQSLEQSTEASPRSGNCSEVTKFDQSSAIPEGEESTDKCNDLVHIEDGVSDEDKEGYEEENESVKNCSVIDISDSSLQNSPVGATRQHFLQQREMADIVADLSVVSNDLTIKQALLDSLNLHTLPDNGRNLMVKVQELKRRKDELEKELHRNTHYIGQIKGLEQMQAEKIHQRVHTKQSTLNFPPHGLKLEPKEEEEELDEYSPSSFKSVNGSAMPEWGDLPKPDMTISGFGRQAMQTHLAEKSLTLEALAKLHKALKTCPSEDTHAEDPKYLKVELMPHQKHGLAWMLWREQEKPSGGILADDMGLGKTLSMISLILKDMEIKETSDDEDKLSDDESGAWKSAKYSRMPKGGTLVVAPASVINQWEQEIYKRVKRRKLSVELYHGAKRETRPRRLAEHDVVITTFNLVSRESGVETAKNATRMKDKGPLFLVKWERIILDEAHMVRNHKSQMALGVCELAGKHRWCLTGTPIQNKELDLYALLKFLRCSPFDDLTVWKKWVDNKNATGMQRLNTMMKSLMLRRTKEELQKKGLLDCLPEKTIEKIDVHLDNEELQIYEKVSIFSSTLFARFLHQRAEKQQALDARYGILSGPKWEQGDIPDNQFATTKELANMHRKMKGLTEVKTHQILVLLLRLRQICCHPGLVKKMVEDGDLDIEGGVEDSSGMDVDLFNQMNNLNINESNTENDEENNVEDELDKSDVISASHPIFSFDRPSAKIRAVLDLLEEKLLDSNDKAIIVSQWTSMLNILAQFLKQMRIKFVSLTGDVPVDKRQEIVNAFNNPSSGPTVMLLSLTAGGVGLNLVGANHLLLVDIHWNPQLEAQACDRIYRVGQKKNVYVYRFVTVNTIEESIKSLQDYKLTLAQNVLTGSANTEAAKLTLEDLKMLFMAPSAIPQAPVLPHPN